MKKKLLSLMVVMSLVVSMTLGVTGCGSKSSDSDKKVLKVAFECAYAPYNWTQESPEVGNGKQAVKIKNADGYAYGYEVELAQRIADELGYELEVYKIEWSSILMGLQDGSYDAVMTGVCYSPERDETYDFSTPYTYIYGALIPKQGNTDITAFSDLAGKKSANSLTSNWADLARENGAEVVGVDGFAQAIELLTAGRVDATLNDNLVFLDYIKQHPDAPIQVAALSEDVSETAFPVVKSEEELTQAIDKALAELASEGKLTEISNKYFGEDVSQAK